MSREELSQDTMLVVEDEEPSRRALQMLLRSRGFQVRAVASAEEALAILAQCNGDPSPHYMVVDVDLPGISGLDLLSRVLASRPDLHAFLVTAADRTIVQTFANQHDVDYFPKPLDVNRFFECVRHTS